MNRVVLLVGSPRGRKSTSTSIGEYLLGQLQKSGYDSESFWVREQLTKEEKLTQMLEAVGGASLIILTAPLYDDCQPFIVTKTMEAIAAMDQDLKGKQFMPIVNCGFSESKQITEAAIPIYKMFASKVGLTWAGSLAIGGGEMVRGAQGLKLDELGKMGAGLRSKLTEISESIVSGRPHPDESIAAFPKFFLGPVMSRLMTRMNNGGWKSRANRNGGIVDARPYESAGE